MRVVWKLAYLGTNYAGLQIQNSSNIPAVANLILKAMATVTRQEMHR